MTKLTPIRDTREHDNEGYYWTESEWCEGYVSKKLDTGDYSLEGYEDRLCIERKRSTGEMAKNITEKRFDRELERMSEFEWAFFVCEFNFEDVLNFPINSTIPQNKWGQLRVTSNFLLSRLTEYQIKYGVHILYCGSKKASWDMVNSIFKKVTK